MEEEEEKVSEDWEACSAKQTYFALNEPKSRLFSWIDVVPLMLEVVGYYGLWASGLLWITQDVR